MDLALSLDGWTCPVAGTAEVKQLGALHDRGPAVERGALLTWSGCGAVSAAFAHR